MRAFIIKDDLDDKNIFNDLITQLENNDIEYTCFSDLKNFKHFLESSRTLDKNESVIFYPSIYVRYSLTSLKELNKDNGFDYIIAGNRIISFKPKVIEVSRDGVYISEGTLAVFFDLANPDQILTYVKPTNLDIPRVFIYSHNRDAYLNMTLNSLMYSLEQCPEVPVTILLNAPTKEVLAVATSFVERYPQVNCLVIDQNIAYYAPNIGVQWYKDKKCIVFEDDILLPAAMKDTYPMWPYQFSYRLDQDGVDYISLRVSFLNIPYSMYQEWNPHDYSQRVGWKYFNKEDFNKKDSPRIMAQCFAWNSSYFSELSKKNQTVVDRTYIVNSEIIAIPNIVCYHIGWNQIQDGYYNYFKWAEGFKYKEYVTQVTDLRTQEKRTISTADIKTIDI